VSDLNSYFDKLAAQQNAAHIKALLGKHYAKHA
jgi:hypothetical protein